MMKHDFTATPPNKLGYFSPQTSAINFCEIDYAVTPYIAEFVNSWSNLAYMYFAVTALGPGHRKLNLFAWPIENSTLFLVGVGSFTFHATLKHEAQMFDELSMYAIITALNYKAYTHPKTTSPLVARSIALALVIPFAAMSYHNIKAIDGASTFAHLVLYTISIHMFWPRVLVLVRADSQPLPPSFAQTVSSQASKQVAHKDRLKQFYFGAFLFLLGFILWFLEGLYCENLRAARAVIRLPFVWILELHGLWHMFTAWGAAKFIRLISELRDVA